MIDEPKPMRTNNVRMSAKSFSTLLVCFTFVLHTASATTVYDQPLNTGFVPIYSEFPNQRCATPFSLPTGAKITKVTWYGFYAEELQSNVKSAEFHVDFLSDLSGVPKPPPSPSPKLKANVTATGQKMNLPGKREHGRAVYRFEVELPSPVVLPARTTNWLSIVGTDVKSRQFNWAKHMGRVDGGAVYPIHGPWRKLSMFGHAAFTLSGELQK